ncbi:ABC transporter ATP-binding protein [Sulfobacillus thermosulfidooxidans]|uniref:ABC transporter ATP-binding protein n=1 Tax=Sulfobacillus thermosulfidooxidans TaxID=28034 RepID=UPI0006B42C69|nr:ABC transporter ATP-binding protein [Sulfobacillus thermosulfidooxidans]
MHPNQPLLQLVACWKSYQLPDGRRRPVLGDVNFTIYPGEIILILGVSGSGKSTLARLLALWDPPDTGQILINGKPIRFCGSQPALTRRRIVLVPQHLALLPGETVWGNIYNILRWQMLQPIERLQRTWEMLDAVGLIHFRDQLAGTLSGGQQQRLALARALACQPEILIADEPTRSLDAQMVERIREIFRTFAVGSRSVVLISHLTMDEELATRTMKLVDGMLT